MSSSFTCKICHKIRKEPIFLPCNCTSICKQHVDDILNRPIKKSSHHSITCQECHKTFDIPPDGFKENKMMRTLIEANSYLNDEERKLKLKLEANFSQLKQLVNDLSHKVDEFTVKQYEHFSNLKNEIDIRRETILIELNKQEKNEKEIEIQKESSDLIKSVQDVEEKFRLTFERVRPELTSVDSNVEESKLEEFFRRSNLTMEAILKLKNESDTKLIELKRKMTYFNYLDYELVQNRFNISLENFEFGK